MAGEASETVHRMPYEGYETSVEAAAEGIAGLLDSDEEHTEETVEEEQEEAEEVEETTNEADEESDDEEETEEVEEEPDQPQAFTVKVDGEEVEVTLDELLKGYSREADYTRKTQALAERSKEIDQYRTVRDQYLGTIQALEQHLTTNEPPKPDPALRQSNPAEYAAQVADRQQWEADQNATKAERQRLEAEKAEEFRQWLAEKTAEEQKKLVEVLPEWADKEKGPALRKSLQTYAVGAGFTEEELGGVVDHRLVVLLDKARRFDALQAKAEPVLKKAKEAPVLKPGARPNASPARGKKKEMQRLQDRARKTGRAEDVAAVLERLLPD